MDKKPKISVAVITYNQQDTIRQTLDSILIQKGDFDLEVVIGEDCGSDATYAICEEYIRRLEMGNWRSENAPNVVTINLLPNTRNLGITANYARVIQACTGDFISNIAGDDYYCDDHALEKQMQYMQAHEEVGVMAANGYSYYVQRGTKEPGLNPIFNAEEDDVKSQYFSSMHFEGAYLAPVGMMYRAELLHKYIDLNEILRRKLPVEDYPIQAILSQHTKFACLPDLLVTYRVYRESASFISYNHPRYLEYYQGLMEIRRYLNELFPNNAIPAEVLQERMFNKEFLYDVHHMKYKDAKQLIASVLPLISESEGVKTARRYTRNWLIFTAYHYYKRIITYKSIKKQV